MEFFLVKDENVVLDQSCMYASYDGIARDTGTCSIPVGIISSGTSLNGSDENRLFYRNFCKDLETMLNLRREPSSAANKKEESSKSDLETIMAGQAFPPVPVCGGLRADLGLKTGNSLCARDWIRISCEHGSRDILEKLKSVLERYGYAVKLSVEISNLEFIGASEVRRFDALGVKWATPEVSIEELSSSGHIRKDGNMLVVIHKGTLLHPSGNWNRKCRRNDSESISCRLTIKATAYCNQWRPLLTTGKDTILQRMLKEKICPDVVIETDHGGEINCHRSVLSAQSPVLEAMFRNDYGFQESKTGRVDMTDMPTAGVKGLIDYMYGEYLKGKLENPRIALEILKVAHKYEVHKLEEIILELFVDKSYEWLGVNEALQLLSFLRNIPEKSNTSSKIIEMALDELKRYICGMEDFPTFHDLLITDPDVVKAVREDIQLELEYQIMRKNKETKKYHESGSHLDLLFR